MQKQSSLLVSPDKSVMSLSEMLFAEEERNLLVFLEHYKLRLTLFLPKVCVLIRKAQGKSNKKVLDKTRATCKYFIVIPIWQIISGFLKLSD